MKSLSIINTGLAAVSLFFNVLMAQTESNNFSAYLSQVRAGSSRSLPYTLLQDEGKFGQVLPVIEQSLSDTLVAVRRACYQSLQVMQQSASITKRKSELLSTQFKGLDDPSPEIVGLTISNLSQLPPALFSKRQQEELASRLGTEIPAKELLVKMMGSQGVAQAIPHLRPLTQPENAPKVRWAAHLALARLGEQPAINFINRRVRSFEVGDDLVYDILPDVIYTRQKQLYDYLVELLNSNERNCEPADPDQGGLINCAFRILEMLASEIADFPIATSASGDLMVTNYRVALQTAREWFAAHPDYQIKTAAE